MTKPKLRIGLIGPGFMGKAHVFGFTSAPRVFELPFDLELHTVADITPEAAERARVTLGFAKATADYPNIERVVDPIESNEDEQTAYERATEIITAYPDIKGFQGSAGTDVAGIARAVAEAGLTDEICVMGTGLPSVAKRYLEDGSIDKIFFWDPARAGEAMLEIALRLANGETIGEGTDLGIEGYESLTVHPERDNVFFGQATVVVDVNNVDDYNF